VEGRPDLVAESPRRVPCGRSLGSARRLGKGRSAVALARTCHRHAGPTRLISANEITVYTSSLGCVLASSLSPSPSSSPSRLFIPAPPPATGINSPASHGSPPRADPNPSPPCGRGPPPPLPGALDQGRVR
jgi:hypothetical protein